MTTNRLEAFSDGVIAIIITIMVLELHVPAGDGIGDLRPLVPKLLSYVMSFAFVGIYWNNHHHLFQASERVNGSVLWSNLHLLFWLSLVPFTTAWMGEREFHHWPVAAYGFVLWMCALAYFILATSLRRLHGPDSLLAHEPGVNTKGRASLALYTLAIPLALLFSWGSIAIYLIVSVMWFLPDRRLERALAPTTPA